MLEQFEADVAGVEPDMPVTFKFKGLACTGQRLPMIDAHDFVDVGFIAKSDFDLLVRPSMFSAVTAPAKGDEFTELESNTYRVDRLNTSQDGITVLYSLVLLT